MQMVVDGVSCSLSSVISAANISSSMKMLCFLWTSASGQVLVYSERRYQAEACSPSAGRTVTPGGRFRLGGQRVQTALPVVGGTGSAANG